MKLSIKFSHSVTAIPRKRTRSVKGQAYDELQAHEKAAKSKSPKRKQPKTLDNEKTKSKVSRRIVFDDDQTGKQVNNNSNVRVIKNGGIKRKMNTKGNNDSLKKAKANATGTKGSKIIDPCFKNVLRKELEVERKQTIAKNKDSTLNSNKTTVLQSIDPKERNRDGININVEGSDLEELDYVDDLIDDEEIEEFEVEEKESNTQKGVNVDNPLPRATRGHMPAKTNAPVFGCHSTLCIRGAKAC